MDPSQVQRNTVQTLVGQLGVAAVPGEVLTVIGGDTVRLIVSIDYRGPGITDTLYGAIGNRGVTFDEIWAGQNPVTFQQSVDWLTHTFTVDIVTDAEHPGLYDIYVKLVNHTEAGMPELADCIEVIGVAEFQNFAITSYEKV